MQIQGVHKTSFKSQIQFDTNKDYDKFRKTEMIIYSSLGTVACGIAGYVNNENGNFDKIANKITPGKFIKNPKKLVIAAYILGCAIFTWLSASAYSYFDAAIDKGVNFVGSKVTQNKN